MDSLSGINLLLNAADLITGKKKRKTAKKSKLINKSNKQRMTTCNNSKVPKVLQVFTVDIYSAFPKLLTKVANSFDKDVLNRFFELRTNPNLEYKQYYDKSPYATNASANDLQINLHTRTEAVKWIMHNWTLHPDKVWMLVNANVSLLEHDEIVIDYNYTCKATVIIDDEISSKLTESLAVSPIDFISNINTFEYLHKLQENSQKQTFLKLDKFRKEIEIDGQVKLKFDSNKIITHMLLYCKKVIKDKKN
jgi:hypothetical protein